MITKTCLQCGKEFKTHKCWVKDGRKFCCRKCYAEWQKINKCGKNNSHWQGGKITLTCLNCGKEFKVVQSRKNAKFCSYKCMGEYKCSGYLIVKCSNCDKSFKTTVSTIKNHRGTYCCKKCKNEHQKILNKGKNNPCWRGGKTPERQGFYNSEEWKEVVQHVWSRDNYHCRRCGIDHNKDNEIHIHHIISFQIKEFRSDIHNLILLCEDCHRWIHSNKNVDKQLILEV